MACSTSYCSVRSLPESGYFRAAPRRIDELQPARTTPSGRRRIATATTTAIDRTEEEPARAGETAAAREEV
jgi:hypothetical protein